MESDRLGPESQFTKTNFRKICIISVKFKKNVQKSYEKAEIIIISGGNITILPSY